MGIPLTTVALLILSFATVLIWFFPDIYWKLAKRLVRFDAGARLANEQQNSRAFLWTSRVLLFGGTLLFLGLWLHEVGVI
jgi:hypothetical protein